MRRDVAAGTQPCRVAIISPGGSPYGTVDLGCFISWGFGGAEVALVLNRVGDEDRDGGTADHEAVQEADFDAEALGLHPVQVQAVPSSRREEEGSNGVESRETVVQIRTSRVGDVWSVAAGNERADRVATCGALQRATKVVGAGPRWHDEE